MAARRFSMLAFMQQLTDQDALVWRCSRFICRLEYAPNPVVLTLPIVTGF